MREHRWGGDLPSVASTTWRDRRTRLAAALRTTQQLLAEAVGGQPVCWLTTITASSGIMRW
ncbi:hypothetical protein [Saccharomonospora marina]|uniref:hypothetical protein n=1 Tax=Saccharomonospora marina TaxID=632569 RepID=UPI0002E707B7|nr:hypothetical protein [Saccharomonospora marina]